MNKTLVSYAALALLGLGGAAAAADAEARGFNFGAFGGRGAIPLASHSASAVQRPDGGTVVGVTGESTDAKHKKETTRKKKG